MKIQKGYKIEIKPNNKQKTLLCKHAGVARFTYNWGVAAQYKNYKDTATFLTYYDQHKILNTLKSSQFPWMYEVSKCAAQHALLNVNRAFIAFFKNIKRGSNKGCPKFKSKHKNKKSFYLDGRIHLKSDRIKLPIFGWIKLKENNYIPNLPIKSVTVSEKAGHWFIATSFEFEVPDQQTTSEVIGIDLGINNLMHTSNNEIFTNPKILKYYIRKLKRYQREVARRQTESKRKERSKKKVANLHYKISNTRKDNLNKITTRLVKTKPSVIVMEDLSLKNMMQTRKLAQALQDSSLSELKRQLIYKSKWNSISLMQVPRFYPSSKMCNKCGNIKETIRLNERVYNCEVCGNIEDRDWNASKNIKDYYTVSSTGINAHGQSVRPKG